MELQPLLLHPIGIIRTPFADRVDAPRQPDHKGEGSSGKIILEPWHNYEQALEDLEGFEKIWLLYQFDRNTNWKPKVLPPRGDRVKRGVFATRSPHRPNPIGLSLVSLIQIDGRNIYVDGVDILDKTPLFDIKPYLPYAEAFPDVKCGWLDETMNAEASREPLAFIVSKIAGEQLECLRTDFDVALLDNAKRVLANDPYPHPSRRIFKDKDGAFAIAIKSWRIIYRIEGNSIIIDEVRSGYRPRALDAVDKTIHQKEAHKAFHKIWGGEK